MAAMQVKFSVLILVVAMVAGTGTAGNGRCEYIFEVKTTFGTKSDVIFGVYDKNGTGWTQTEHTDISFRSDSGTVEDRARNVVDVRDLADALALVYERSEASGRYICSPYRKRLSEMVDMARSFCPDINQPKKFVEAENDDRRMSSRKMQALGLGWKFRAVEECLKDSVESYKAAGFL